MLILDTHAPVCFCTVLVTELPHKQAFDTARGRRQGQGSCAELSSHELSSWIADRDSRHRKRGALALGTCRAAAHARSTRAGSLAPWTPRPYLIEKAPGCKCLLTARAPCRAGPWLGASPGCMKLVSKTILFCFCFVTLVRAYPLHIEVLQLRHDPLAASYTGTPCARHWPSI